MNNYWLSIALSLALPLLVGTHAVILLRRAIRPARTHWFALAASAMVFTFSTLWLAKSAKLLYTLYSGAHADQTTQWLSTNLQSGPYLAFSMLVLSGGFWLHLVWTQRKAAPKQVRK